MTQPSVIALPRIPFKATGSSSAALNYSWGQPVLSQASWGSALTTANSPSAASAGAGPSSPTFASTPTTLSRRRRRDSSEDDSHELKRFRRASPASPSKHSPAAAATLHQQPHPKSVEQLTHELATLSHPALLKVVHSLLATSPHLAPTVSALLPVPSLQDAIDSLQQTERDVIQAIPANSRPDYTLGRVKHQLDAYVANARNHINTFVPKATSDPSATISFLSTLTSSLRLLEFELPRPSPLDTALLPMTINAWHTVISKLAHEVNDNGKMISLSTIQTWYAQLDALCSAVHPEREGPARKSIEGVRERLRRELGWLSGGPH